MAKVGPKNTSPTNQYPQKHSDGTIVGRKPSSVGSVASEASGASIKSGELKGRKVSQISSPARYDKETNWLQQSHSSAKSSSSISSGSTISRFDSRVIWRSKASSQSQDKSANIYTSARNGLKKVPEETRAKRFVADLSEGTPKSPAAVAPPLADTVRASFSGTMMPEARSDHLPQDLGDDLPKAVPAQQTTESTSQTDNVSTSASVSPKGNLRTHEVAHETEFEPLPSNTGVTTIESPAVSQRSRWMIAPTVAEQRRTDPEFIAFVKEITDKEGCSDDL